MPYTPTWLDRIDEVVSRVAYLTLRSSPAFMVGAFAGVLGTLFTDAPTLPNVVLMSGGLGLFTAYDVINHPSPAQSDGVYYLGYSKELAADLLIGSGLLYAGCRLFMLAGASNIPVGEFAATLSAGTALTTGLLTCVGMLANHHRFGKFLLEKEDHVVTPTLR